MRMGRPQLCNMSSISVLIVEDNPGDVYLIQLQLIESNIPMEIRVANDGHEAVHLIFEQGLIPDLILLDLNLPKLDGYEVLKRIRDGKAPDTPVVVFSCSTRNEDIERATMAGASDYVVKPVDLERFNQAVAGIVKIWIRPLTYKSS